MNNGYHIYSQHLEPDGPLPTSFEFIPSKDYELIGKVEEQSPVIKKYDSILMMPIKWFDKQAILVQRIKLKSSSAVVKGKVAFMACNDEQCLPPEEKEFVMEIK